MDLKALNSLQPRAIEALGEYITERLELCFKAFTQAKEEAVLRQTQGAVEELNKLQAILNELKHS